MASLFTVVIFKVPDTDIVENSRVNFKRSFHLFRKYCICCKL